jgi:hypothetical protein
MTTYVAAKFGKLKNVTLGNGVGALKYNSFIKNTLSHASALARGNVVLTSSNRKREK